MTSTLLENDKIFTLYKQYKNLLIIDRRRLGVENAEQIASNLTVAHMLDHVVCLLKNEKEDPIIAGNEELEIMRNNARLEDIPLCR